jgi:hypothetical protein
MTSEVERKWFNRAYKEARAAGLLVDDATTVARHVVSRLQDVVERYYPSFIQSELNKIKKVKN